jgi:HAD superfamily hydrolase (TIGR01484 family)
MTDFPQFFRGIKRITTDLDNTLFFAGTDQLPPGFFSAVEKWRQKGGRWIIATGRPHHRLLDFFESWSLYPDYSVASERFIYHYPNFEIEIPFRSWNQRMEELSLEVEEKFPSLVKPVLNWARELNVEVERQEFSLRFKKESKAKEAEKILAGQLLDTDEIITVRNRVHLGIAPANAGKGSCLEYIASSRGWEPDQMLCIGDSANDRDMLDGRFGFKSAAVANAEPEIKTVVRKNGGLVFKLSAGHAIVDCFECLLNQADSST